MPLPWCPDHDGRSQRETAGELVDPLELMDAASMIGELVSKPLHVGLLLTLSPQKDAGHGFVDDLYRDTLASRAEQDPQLRRCPARASTPPASGCGAIWTAST